MTNARERGTGVKVADAKIRQNGEGAPVVGDRWSCHSASRYVPELRR
jgi:hypothetical protein